MLQLLRVEAVVELLVVDVEENDEALAAVAVDEVVLPEVDTRMMMVYIT